MAEGARLESVYTFTGIVGSNPTLSASLYLIDSIALILSMEESVLFPASSFVFNGLECIHTVVHTVQPHPRFNYSDALAEVGPTHSLRKHTTRSHNLARSTQLKRYGQYSLSQFGTVASAGDHRGPANAPFQRRNRLPPPPHSSRRARL